MSKIILFNSPKNVGKSEAIKYLKTKGINLISAECKESLHKLTMTLFGVSSERYWEIYNTRELKEVPLLEFHIHLDFEDLCRFEEILGYYLIPHEDDEWGEGYPRLIGNTSGSLCEVNLSIREAMIYVSEVIVKPRWGEDWFGQERVRKMNNMGWSYVDLDTGKETPIIFTDDSCAFVDELTPLIEYIGQGNILLLRIHREGFTFEGDSRDYIPDGVITNTVDIYNNGTEQEYFDLVEGVVKTWLNK